MHLSSRLLHARTRVVHSFIATLTLLLALGCDQGSTMTAAGESCSEGCEYVPERAVPPVGSPVERYGQLQVVGTTLVDQSGEPVQLKGVSSMWLNWETSGYAQSRAGLEWLRDNWNVSLIRAAMGVEPQGAYLTNPADAKRKLRQVVENAIELGVYVLIDWHDHAAEDHAVPAQAFFEEMAATYGAYPNVLYETYNEPLDVSWSGAIKPYHEAMVSAIRAIDPDNVIVLGTPEWSQKVDDAAEDPVSGDNLMYTLHFYACTHQSWLRDRADAALAQDLPLFVTEWGATEADGGVQNKSVCDAEGQAWHDWMNEHHVSWAAWKLDDCNDASCILRQGAPPGGPFDDASLNGHGPFVRDRLLE